MQKMDFPWLLDRTCRLLGQMDCRRWCSPGISWVWCVKVLILRRLMNLRPCGPSRSSLGRLFDDWSVISLFVLENRFLIRQTLATFASYVTACVTVSDCEVHTGARSSSFQEASSSGATCEHQVTTSTSTEEEHASADGRHNNHPNRDFGSDSCAGVVGARKWKGRAGIVIK